ncbi:MAG: methionyl-tRNA formyltransferase [Candidatus Pacebacteria bacterium]|nr:methionyl-tRNA formyltransferase [Candidatus Paceibacterota bacterium]
MNNNAKPSIAFFGTPELCIPILQELQSAGIIPVVIVTNPDKPVGRKQIMTPSPVKIWGQENNIPVLEPKKLDTDFQNTFALYNVDLSLVVAYGKIIPETLIHTSTFGTINVHYSLLPKYRGASPVESSILSGDTETGVCIQDMAYDLDSGDIYVQEIIPIDINETAPELRNRLNDIAKKMLVKLIPQIVSGEAVKTPQTGEPTYCKKTKKEDGQIFFDTMTDAQLWNMYRGYFGWPGIFYFDENGKRIKITKARFEQEKFIIEKIIPEGKKEQEYKKSA